MKKLSPEEVQDIQDTLHHVVTSRDLKLSWGAAMRDELRRASKAGEALTGYRIDWLREAKKNVIQALVASSESFNLRYSHDRISAADLHDVISAVLSHLETSAKG